jgi:ribosomal-protein-alanine N-acetyltransferase
MPHTIRTERLLLRRPTARDAKGLERMINDPLVTAQTESWAYPSDAEIIRRRFAFMNGLDPRESSVFLVIPGDGIAGMIGLLQRRSATYGLGYMIGRAHWGQGLASEAARAMCAHAFRVLGAQRIEADVFTGNEGSIRVLEKAGFRPLGDTGPGWSATRRANFPRVGFALTREGWSP